MSGHTALFAGAVNVQDNGGPGSIPEPATLWLSALGAGGDLYAARFVGGGVGVWLDQVSRHGAGNGV